MRGIVIRGSLPPVAILLFGLAAPPAATAADGEVEMRFCRAATRACDGPVHGPVEGDLGEALRLQARMLEDLAADSPFYRGEPWEPEELLLLELAGADLVWVVVEWHMGHKASVNDRVEVYRMRRQDPTALVFELSVPDPSIDADGPMGTVDPSEPWYANGYGFEMEPIFASPREAFLVVNFQNAALNPMFSTASHMIRFTDTAAERFEPGIAGPYRIVDVDDAPPVEIVADEWGWADYFLYKIGVSPRITKIFAVEAGGIVEACRRYLEVYREELAFIERWVERELADPVRLRAPAVPVDPRRLEAALFDPLAPAYRSAWGRLALLSAPRSPAFEAVETVLLRRAHVADALVTGILTALQAALFDEAERFHARLERFFATARPYEAPVARYTLADMRETIDAVRAERGDRPCPVSYFRAYEGEGLYHNLLVVLAQELRARQEDGGPSVPDIGDPPDQPGE